jgi:hypothetical protein
VDGVAVLQWQAPLLQVTAGCDVLLQLLWFVLKQSSFCLLAGVVFMRLVSLVSVSLLPSLSHCVTNGLGLVAGTRSISYPAAAAAAA